MRTVLNSAVDPLLGRLLDGRYEIKSRIARGGMAVVYTAFDTRLDRPVAVKVMHPVFAADEDFVARFRREAKAAARLSDPHVVSVSDQGRDGDVIFLVMELVEGRTLREVLREAGRLPVADALQVMVPVLKALAAAHRAGLIHRDVKPENVLVGAGGEIDGGEIKVGDFGLARAVDASPLTATTGLLLGTVAYLAPEQVARGVADARADVYACGVMLFELLTGRPPFRGDSPLQVAYQHLNDSVPAPSSLIPGIPAAVDRLVAAATARDPADRPHDATALLFRSQAVLERLAPPVADFGRQHTAPLEPARPRAKPPTADRVRADPPRATGSREPLEEFQDPLEMEPLVVSLAAAPDPDTGDLPAADVIWDGDDAGDAGDAGDGRRRKLLRPGRIALLVVVLLSVAAGLIGWKLATRTVAIPAVLGTSPAAAEAALRDAHLKSHVDAVQVYSETAKKGTVAATDPAIGDDTSRGTDVALKVSLGPERYTVPTLTKLSVADADAALRVSHLRAGQRTDGYSDTVPSGALISSTPAAGGQVKPDTPVDYVVSKGPAPVTVPKLSGLTGDAAQQTLTKLGLKVTVTQEFSETVQVGYVTGLSPSKGLHRTQAVTLSVSKGPQLVQIPSDIKRYNPTNAKKYLEQLGLKVATYNLPGLDTRVVGVDPDAGSMVKVGATVTLILI